MTTHEQSSPDVHNSNELSDIARELELQHDWKQRMKVALRLVGQEVQQIALVTIRHAHQLMLIVWNFVQRRIGYWRLKRQKLILGEQLYAKGLGDTGLRNQISELDDAIQRAKANKQPLRQYARSRLAFLARLTDQIPEGTNSTIAANVERVRSIQKQVENLEDMHRKQLNTPSPTVDEWNRIVAGYGMTILFLVLAFRSLPIGAVIEGDSAGMFDLRSSQAGEGASSLPVNPEIAVSMNATESNPALTRETASVAKEANALVPGEAAALKLFLQHDSFCRDVLSKRPLSDFLAEIPEALKDTESSLPEIGYAVYQESFFRYELLDDKMIAIK